MPKKKKVKKNKEKEEAWFRLIVLIVSGIIISLWSVPIKFLAVVNWFITVFSGKRNKDIAEFSEYFNTEVYKYIHYLTFMSNKRPFPFTKMEKLNKFEK